MNHTRPTVASRVALFLAVALARQVQLAADLLDRLPLNKIRAADLGDRFHNQHPKLGSR